GGLAESQLRAAIECVVKRDPELAGDVVKRDTQVDEIEIRVDERATRLLALRQPVAVDLRRIIGSLRISSDIERIADYAANIAKRSVTLSQAAPVRPVHIIPRMGRMALTQIKDVLDAYTDMDAEKA